MLETRTVSNCAVHMAVGVLSKSKSIHMESIFLNCISYRSWTTRMWAEKNYKKNVCIISMTRKQAMLSQPFEKKRDCTIISYACNPQLFSSFSPFPSGAVYVMWTCSSKQPSMFSGLRYTTSCCILNRRYRSMVINIWLWEESQPDFNSSNLKKKVMTLRIPGLCRFFGLWAQKRRWCAQ